MYRVLIVEWLTVNCINFSTDFRFLYLCTIFLGFINISYMYIVSGSYRMLKYNGKHIFCVLGSKQISWKFVGCCQFVLCSWFRESGLSSQLNL